MLPAPPPCNTDRRLEWESSWQHLATQHVESQSRPNPNTPAPPQPHVAQSDQSMSRVECAHKIYARTPLRQGDTDLVPGLSS
eukprot:1242142-Rhodomonas_salina.1